MALGCWMVVFWGAPEAPSTPRTVPTPEAGAWLSSASGHVSCNVRTAKANILASSMYDQKIYGNTL